MEKKIIFKGVATALLTPFKDGKIDYPSLEKIIEMQIEAKIPALVVGGTTGEVATLSDAERYALFRFAKGLVKDRAKLIFGTGTNDTEAVIKHTRFAEELGCDGALVVTPYYNKGTDEGLIKHYEKIANSTNLPIILYNVPTRTGVNLTLSQLERLSCVTNIVAIKEASDSLDRLVEISLMSEKLSLIAGSDSAVYSVLSLGGVGVISVISNFCPRETAFITESFFAGRTERALEMQKRLVPFIKACFLETNPAPIKYAMSRLGLCENELRLPLSQISKRCAELIDKTLADLKL